MSKKALITGITGQDGSYLAELLLKKDYEVYGLVRRVALEDPAHRLRRIYHIRDKLHLVSGTLESYPRLVELFERIKPNECYHLAAQSFVHESFEDSFSTFNININGTHNVLSALNQKSPNCKFYFAGSSEMFGEVLEVPQTEETKFNPRSPYGVTKVAGFYLTKNYREAHNLFACNGILFNHESPRRGFEFVTRKITSTIAKIEKGLEGTLVLGNLDSKRDWGFAGDYVKAMWLMLQQDEPNDYVIATGENHTVREFVELAFKTIGKELIWKGRKEKERGYDSQKGNLLVKVNKEFYRPAEIHELLGDSTKAKEAFGWKPEVSFKGLVEMMIKDDYNRLKKENNL